MVSKLIIVLITAFWMLMCALLWRAEFGSRQSLGAAVPAHIVWDKILTSPDTSTLEIRRGTNRIGYCKWRADVGQEFATGARMSENMDPIEGMVRQLAFYQLDVDGNVTWPDFPQRLRFDVSFKADTNRVWQELNIQLTARPDVYELRVSAVEEVVRLRIESGADRIERVFAFSDFRNPQKLLSEFGGPTLPLMLGALGAPMTTNGFSVSSALRWEAHKTHLLLGRNSIPAYRLKAMLFQRYSAMIYVSPVGEILRIELPNKISLLNDAVISLQEPP